MEFNKKEMDITFEKLLKDSAIVINQRRGNSMKKVNSSFKKKILKEIKNIFDLDAELDLNTFKRDYINKKHSPTICKENLIKNLYLFIFKSDINDKKDIETQVNNIINFIKKMEDSDLPLPKKYLTEKLKKLKEIKLIKTSTKDLSSQLNSELETFKNNPGLDTENTEKIIDLMIDEHLKPNVDYNQRSEKLEYFCKTLTNKLLNPENQENTPEFYAFIENIIPKLINLYDSTGIEKDYKTVKDCISIFRKVRRTFRPETEKFKKIEEKRKIKSHNRESLNHFFDIQKLTIDEANEIIKQTDNIKPIDINELPKFKNCEKFLKKSSSENIDEEIFDSYVKETRDEIKKVIYERSKQSAFGAKVPSSDKILSEILNLF